MVPFLVNDGSATALANLFGRLENGIACGMKTTNDEDDDDDDDEKYEKSFEITPMTSKRFWFER